DIPPTPEDDESGLLRKLAGSVIVTAVGFVLTAPFGGFILATAGWLIPFWVAGLLAFVLTPIAFLATQYVGGPVADHVLDIPREVSE
ncbi:hypothetical protein DJ71_07120, partial [Halorubrum sp. E3]